MVSGIVAQKAMDPKTFLDCFGFGQAASEVFLQGGWLFGRYRFGQD
jgi:hypothetical protein